MNPIKSIFSTLKSSVKQFFAMYFFAIIASVFSSIYIIEKTSIFSFDSNEWAIPFILDSIWFIVFSILLKFIFEKYFVSSKKNKILSFVIPLFLSIPCYFFCKSYETFDYFYLIYFATLIAEILFCTTAFYEYSKEKNGANLFLSSMISGIVCACVATSLTIIILAIRYLIFEFDENLMTSIISSIWVTSSLIVFIGLFVSYSSKKYEEIVINKPFKVVFLNALFPLYIVLLAVLYVYIFKAIFTLTLPSGMLNPFVSIATLVFVIFYLTLQIYENKSVKFFIKFGGIFMIPLIITQIIAFSIRVNAYGLTKTRYASLLYIIFSSIFVILVILNNLKKDKINLTKFAYSILACFFIFACLPKVNLIDISELSMKNNIEKIYKSHNLFDESTGKFIKENVENIFSIDEKNLILTSYREINPNIENTSWIEKKYEYKWSDNTELENRTPENAISKKAKIDFEKTFGFEYRWNYYEKDNAKCLGMNFECPQKDNVFDVSDFSKIHEISKLCFRKVYDSAFETNIGRFFIETSDGLKLDVTDYIKPQFSMIIRYGDKRDVKREPYIFDIYDGKYRIICTDIAVYENEHKDNKDYDCSASGYILSK